MSVNTSLEPLTTNQLNIMTRLADTLRTYGDNATTNVKSAFRRLTPTQYLRLLILICAYILFRKYILKHAASRQQRAMEEESTTGMAAGGAQLSPNDLRSGSRLAKPTLEDEAKTYKYPGIPDDTDDESDDDTDHATATGGDMQWGKKATRRQRQALRILLDAEEKRLKQKIGDDEDEDIKEFLIDDHTS